MENKLIELGRKIHIALKNLRTTGLVKYGDDLAGACAIGSSLLVQEAERLYGIGMKFTACDLHAWAEYKDYIYDVTASQFGCIDKVFTTRIKDIHLSPNDDNIRWCYRRSKRVNLEHVNEEWPRYQRPKYYKIHWLFNTIPVVTYQD